MSRTRQLFTLMVSKLSWLIRRALKELYVYLPTTLVGWIILDQASYILFGREGLDFQLLLTILSLMLAFTGILFTAPQKTYGKPAEQLLYSSSVFLAAIGVFYFIESVEIHTVIEIVVGSIGIALAFNSAYNLVGSVSYVYDHLDDSFRA